MYLRYVSPSFPLSPFLLVSGSSAFRLIPGR